MGKHEIPGYWSVGAVARLTGLHPDTVRYHCRQGSLAGTATLVGRAYLIPDQAVVAFASDLARRRSEA